MKVEREIIVAIDIVDRVQHLRPGSVLTYTSAINSVHVLIGLSTADVMHVLIVQVAQVGPAL
jgi:hypothetical protein